MDLPQLTRSPIGKAAICAVLAAFVSVLIGGWSFGHHLTALGLVFAALAGLSLVALFGIGLVAAVMLVPRRIRPPVSVTPQQATGQRGPDGSTQPYGAQEAGQGPEPPESGRPE
jgi:hypothetical protein